MSDKIVVDRLELLKLLKNLNTTKSSAIENLSSRLVKDSLVCLIDQFVFLVNLSFRTGKFPTDWKKAVIIPLPKDGDLSICNNLDQFHYFQCQVKSLKKYTTVDY